MVGVWRLIGRGRLRFPMLPRQLPDLAGPYCMQKKDHYYLRSWRPAVGLPLAINGKRGRSPCHPSLPLVPLLLLLPRFTACCIDHGADTEVLGHREGKSPREEPGPLLPKKRLARRRDVVERPEVTRPWHERPPPGYPLPLYAQAEGSEGGGNNRRRPCHGGAHRRRRNPRRGLLARVRDVGGDASAHVDAASVILHRGDAAEGAT